MSTNTDKKIHVHSYKTYDAFRSFLPGSIVYLKNDEVHREDGPALENADGTKVWYRNDMKHREDGPAVEQADGTKKWFIHGVLHRTDGPAIEYPEGGKEWYLNGRFMTQEQFTNRMAVARGFVEIEGKKYKLVEMD